MTIIALMGGKGSPGVSTTTLALALAWPLASGAQTNPAAAVHDDVDADRDPDRGGDRAERVLVVEADAAGASSWSGYLRGQYDPAAGMSCLLAAAPDAIGGLLPEAVLELEGDPHRFLLPGLRSPQQMAAHAQDWPVLAQWLTAASRAHHRTDVLVDLGRVGALAEPAAILAAADAVVVVCRTDLPSALGAVNAIAYLQGTPARQPVPVGCLLVGEKQPYTLVEVQATVQVPVLGALAWDPASAWVFSQGARPGRGFRSGKLMRSAVLVAQTLSAWAHAAMVDGIAVGPGAGEPREATADV